METDEEIKVERLSSEEAWNMFRGIVGAQIVEYPDIETLSRLIVKECGGLPQMIAAVAGRLRRNDKEELWWHTLDQLQSPFSYRMGHREEVLKAFKLGYDHLEDDDRRECLLYGALYPDDHVIPKGYLIECWTAEGFIRGAENLRRTRDTGSAILQDLVDRCLLERTGEDHIKMPIFYQESALKIASLNEKHGKLMVRAGVGMQEPPAEGEWEQVQRISMMCNELLTLRESSNCYMITTLLLQKNSKLTMIPASFFWNMHNLKVLGLYHAGIEILPSSLSRLINLRVLYLNSCCCLVDLPGQIVELKKLEVLDIRNTGIRKHTLPFEIGELTGLRRLRMSFTNVGNQNHVQDESARMMIPQNVISKLLLLEELSIDVDPQDQRWDKMVDIIAKHVAILEQLNTLHFYFPRVQSLEKFVESSRSWNTNCRGSNPFRYFKFLVGAPSSEV